ncbi:acyl-CoA dehydrogenase [Sulfurovum sp. ST-21]|uniref:Acyl-coenzyme A dehydrogenase n=1 Tax=Sulfurovum indicum TaxID=2779528 RepID=A0A7M1S5P2_9BACT|nr:acyl-CoA dehydrogenase [Sulfurovum indicum]QOR62743.1 acyl-CoA dehydrogenase [Sulfurovum indicum]
MTVFLFITGVVVLAYFSAPLWIWFIGLSGVLFYSNAALWWWIPFIGAGAVFLIREIRIRLVTQPLFSMLESKGLLPKISDTEKTALRAGDIWIEGELFSGKPDFQKIFENAYPKLTDEEKAFLDNEVNEVCAMTSDWEVFENRDLPKEVWEYIKEKRFFGMIIPKVYGGLGFSAYAHSCVIEKLASCSQVLAITVMVPNSLGPAELLLHYGSVTQKKHYLPRLAVGREIPCFALTEPEAGSDAASIQSEGVVFRDDHGEIKIRLNFEKRYITLSAIATVIGLAFVLKDPEGLLGKGKKEWGITCALVDAKNDGVDQSRRHDPLSVPFVNAPLLGKDVIISIDDVIGGREGLGKGWQMLMESLAVGRGISLPSTSTGGSKLATFVASTYAVVRYQFGLSIGKFEGVAEVIGRLGASTYMLDAAKTFTLGAIDKGVKPAVANAIMKYQSTEIFRKNIMDAMDIQGGAAISRGPRNLLAHAYFGAPVAITVEGANIMTRTLIMFGQGMIRCHPYIYPQIEALEEGDIEAFDDLLFSHIGHVVRNKARALVLGMTRGYAYPAVSRGKAKRYEQKLAWASARFAYLSDLTLGVVGASLKRRESVSGRFGDILAQMYLITAALKRFDVEGRPKSDEVFLEVAVEEAFGKIDLAFKGILENLLPGISGIPFRFLSWYTAMNPMGKTIKDTSLHRIAKELTENDSVRQRICTNIYMGERQTQLKEATHKMQSVKTALEKEKKGEMLSEEEAIELAAARVLQHEIITVDSFEHDVYMGRADKKV